MLTPWCFTGQLDDLHGDHQRGDQFLPEIRWPNPSSLVVHDGPAPARRSETPASSASGVAIYCPADRDVQPGDPGRDDYDHQLRAQELQRHDGDRDRKLITARLTRRP